MLSGGAYAVWRTEQTSYLVILLPDLCVLATEDLGVKVAIALAGNSLRVCLAANFDAIATGREADHLWDEGIICWIEEEGGAGGWRGRMHWLACPRHVGGVPG